jgi:type VI protein secretion system component Hcp
MKRNYCFLSFCFLAFIVASTNAYSGIKLLMNIPGIDGEYTGVGYEKWIQLNAFSGEIGPGGCDVFHVEKALDSTSAAILMSTALGTFYKEIAVAVLQTGGAGATYRSALFSLNNAVIASVSQGGSDGDDSANENLTIAPGNLVLKAYQLNNEGAVVLAGEANVDCGKIKK